jgi:hypothetical protein
MKNITLILLATAFLISCSSKKQTEEALATGHYDEAIAIALKNLRTNKNKKGKQPYIIMLESAYRKVQRRDLERITYLKSDGNPANLERIYNLYLALKNRQERIKPLLPLYIIEKGAAASFAFTNYDPDIIAAKNQLSAYLYTNAKNLLNTPSTKMDYRSSYDDFQYLNKINPGYKDVQNLMNEARLKGTDFVYVAMRNETNKVIPKRLEDDLLDFNTYGLNDLWTVYHSKKTKGTVYDFGLKIELRDINISPERVREKIIIRDKEIKDGWEYLVDDQGNEVKDSLGNSIKVDRYKKITCELFEFTQHKATQVLGSVRYHNLNTQQLLQSYPIASEYVFEHRYATYNGDKRALNNSYLNLIRMRAVPFPSNEQMIFDTGEDLKRKIKAIIRSNKFRS